MLIREVEHGDSVEKVVHILGLNISGVLDESGEAVVQAGAVVVVGACVEGSGAHEVAISDHGIEVSIADLEFRLAVAVGISVALGGEALAVEATTVGVTALHAHGLSDAVAADELVVGLDGLAFHNAKSVVRVVAVELAVGLVDLAVRVQTAELSGSLVSTDVSEGANVAEATAEVSLVVVEDESLGAFNVLSAEGVAVAGGGERNLGVGLSLGAFVDLELGRAKVDEVGGPVDGLVAVELAVAAVVVEGLAVEVEGSLSVGGSRKLLVKSFTVVAEAITDVLRNVGVAESDVLAVAVVLQLGEVDLGGAAPVVAELRALAEATVFRTTNTVLVTTVAAGEAAVVRGVAGSTPAAALAGVVVKGHQLHALALGNDHALLVAVARVGPAVVLGDTGVVVASGATEADTAGLGGAAEVLAAGGVPGVTSADVVSAAPAVTEIVAEGPAVDFGVADTVSKDVVGLVDVLAHLQAVVHSVVRGGIRGERIGGGGAGQSSKEKELHRGSGKKRQRKTCKSRQNSARERASAKKRKQHRKQRKNKAPPSTHTHTNKNDPHTKTAARTIRQGNASEQ